MAVCKSLQHIFEKQLPENQTLLESVTSSWSQNVKPVEQTERSSFSELFGDLYSKDALSSPLFASLPISYDQNPLSSIDSSQMSTNKSQNENDNHKKDFPFSFPLGNNHSSFSKIDIGFSSVKSESLQLCTEGLGSESSDDVEDLQVEMINGNWQIKEEKVVSASVKHVATGTSSGELRRSRMSRQAFPPPLSFIGRSGKTGVCFTSYRQDGRFVLKEVRIPTQEFLQARREDGRLKLQIVQSDDYILEEEDEADEEQDDVEGNERNEEETDDSGVGNNGQS
ncbi:protein FANTASTIC FOUR 3-like [Benincasa hispida]|uniref:protein FANTASTIC FOUR 3-like n=1 Tax=Benincasa hispida TaxID=102211 RepID=UPI0018FF6631|nr:protein FANTASTIC FOUR 3-like [Benincasa hispida]